MFTFPDPTLQDESFDPNMLRPLPVNYAQPTNYGPAVTSLGGGFAAASQMIAGTQSAALLRANAGIARTQAAGEITAGAEQAEMYRQHLATTVGDQVARTGGAGFSQSGSPLRSLERTEMLGAQDLQRIQTNAARKAWGFSTTAAGDDARAQMATRGGIASGLGTLITSGARAYGAWSAD